MITALRSCFLLALASAVALTGCKRSTPSAQNATAGGASNAAIKLGFLVKQPEEPWFQYEWRGAEKAAAKYNFTLMKSGVKDGEAVFAQMENLSVAGAQGFVICTPDVRLGPQIMAKAKQAGLKVITIDDQFLQPDGSIMKDVPYLGMSASQIGHAQGEALIAEYKKRGWSPEETAACVITFEELDTARERTDNAIVALKEAGFPESQIFKAPQKTTDIPGSFDAANILLTQKPNVKHWLISGMNDSAVLGAVRALEGRGFSAENVIGIGINGTDCIDELRKSKPTGFFGSMLVSAPAEGYETAEMLYKWVKDGTTPPLETRTTGILITRANFEEVLKREGLIP
ncbi:MAG TPA: arabinose ABC transporter substrate-binding protein [Opitutaceae bacterium]|nr:arabinose ABC transporter substrate-binding protein [Opitutaceae bacterium]